MIPDSFLAMSDETKHTRFGTEPAPKRVERNRVLTMKYGKHQMTLIRKRMTVESWMDDEIQKLFNGKEENGVDVELDTLLDMPSVYDKRKFMFDQLQRAFCPASMDTITLFLDQLMEQLNTL